MKVRYLLVIPYLLISTGAMAQHRRSHRQAEDTATSAPRAIDTTTVQGVQDRKIEEAVPETVDNFCAVLTQLITDAGTNFARIKGKEIETINNSTTFICMGGIPGAVTSSLTSTPSKWHYEGIVFQGGAKDDMQVAYERYKTSLENCLPAKGYVVSEGKGSTSKLESFPERRYSLGGEKPSGNAKDAKHTTHPQATLKVDYTTGADIYVVTVNIWSN